MLNFSNQPSMWSNFQLHHKPHIRLCSADSWRSVAPPVHPCHTLPPGAFSSCCPRKLLHIGPLSCRRYHDFWLTGTQRWTTTCRIYLEAAYPILSSLHVILLPPKVRRWSWKFYFLSFIKHCTFQIGTLLLFIEHRNFLYWWKETITYNPQSFCPMLPCWRNISC